MKINNKDIERFRLIEKEVYLYGEASTGTNRGCFKVPFQGRDLVVIASDGDGWDHVSVSLPNRCPNWPEMCHIKELFFADDEVVFQLHPAKINNINNHPYCLHLWRPQDEKTPIPLPPDWMVGIKGLECDSQGNVMKAPE